MKLTLSFFNDSCICLWPSCENYPWDNLHSYYFFVLWLRCVCWVQSGRFCFQPSITVNSIICVWPRSTGNVSLVFT